MTRETGYTIRTMAARCRMTAHTLRYYERVGLIQSIERGHNGHRRYSDDDEAWLKFLQFLRGTQMPIREIQRYAGLRDKGVDGWPEQRRIVEEHGRKLEEQIVTLQRALTLLTAHVENHAVEEHAAFAPPLQQCAWEKHAVEA